MVRCYGLAVPIACLHPITGFFEKKKSQRDDISVEKNHRKQERCKHGIKKYHPTNPVGVECLQPIKAIITDPVGSRT